MVEQLGVLQGQKKISPIITIVAFSCISDGLPALVLLDHKQGLGSKSVKVHKTWSSSEELGL